MEDKIKTEIEYEGMSLRHEKVENSNLPRLNVFYSPESLNNAKQICYGIEEEGLPRKLIECEAPFMEALEDTLKKGLGVSIGVNMQSARIYSRQFKKSEAFMVYEGNNSDMLRTVGKNASRILKHKPFILEE